MKVNIFGDIYCYTWHFLKISLHCVSKITLVTSCPCNIKMATNIKMHRKYFKCTHGNFEEMWWRCLKSFNIMCFNNISFLSVKNVLVDRKHFLQFSKKKLFNVFLMYKISCKIFTCTVLQSFCHCWMMNLVKYHLNELVWFHHSLLLIALLLC